MTDFFAWVLTSFASAFRLLEVQVLGIPLWAFPVGAFIFGRLAAMLHNREG